jgi:hypothetical protein
MQAPAVVRYAGEQAISVSVIQLPIFHEGRTGAVARAGPSRGRSTVRDFTGGIRTRFTRERSIRSLHHQRWFGREDAANQKIKLFRSRRVNGAPLLRTSKKGSLCHRCPACAFVPSDRPRAFGRTPLRREPRDPGLPFRLCAGIFQTSRASENKKPSGAARLGRVRGAECRFANPMFARPREIRPRVALVNP